MPLHRKPSAQGAQGRSTPSSGQGSGDGNEREQDADQGLANLLAEHNNDPVAALNAVLRENFKVRERARKAEGRVRDAVVLSGEDAAAWEAYQKLGKPSEIATKLRESELERVAGRAGYDAEVFKGLDSMAGGSNHYEVKTETVDGKEVERWYVTDGSDADAKPQLLSDYAAAKWGKFAASLQPQAAHGGSGSNQQPAGAPRGIPFPAQGAGGGAAKGSPDLVDKFVKEQADRDKAVENPLLRN